MRLRPKSIAPALLLGAVAAGCFAFEATGLRLNLTPSLPRGLYRLTPEPPSVGDLIAVCLPEGLGALGRARGYVGPGHCPGRAAPLLKRLGAGAGDRVRVAENGVFVNGRRLQPSAPSTDSKGRPLLPLPEQELVIAPGEVWVYAPHPRSWDSRYLGPLSRSSVLGRVVVVWAPAGQTAAETSPRRGPGRSS